MPRKPSRQTNDDHAAVGTANTSVDRNSLRGSLREWLDDSPSTLAFKLDRVEQMSEPVDIEMGSWRGELVEAVESRLVKHLVASPLAAQLRHLNEALESLGEYVCTSCQLVVSEEEVCWAINHLRCIHGDDEESAQRLADALESAPRHGRLLSLHELVALYGFVSMPLDASPASPHLRKSAGEYQPSDVDARQVRMAVLKAAMRGIRAAFYFRNFDRENGLTG